MVLNAIPPEPEPSNTPGIPKSYKQAKFPRFLKSAQRYSAYGIATFAGLHLTSTIILPAFSIDLANTAFMASRSVYQSGSGEMLLVYGSFGVHIVSGITLHAYRIYKQYYDYGRINFGKPSKTAVYGLALSVAFAWHFLSMRYGPLLKLGDSSLISLEYVTHALQNYRVQTSISLGSLITLFSMHTLGGAAQVFGTKLGGKKMWIATIAGIVTLSTLSLSNLLRQPAVTGWVAGQYVTAHHLLANINVA